MGMLDKMGGMWNQTWGDIGGGVARLGTGINKSTDVYDAYIRSGMNPQQATLESAKWLAQREATPTTDYNKIGFNQPTPMASGQANAFVNPQATAQVAQGINSGYSLLGQSKLPAQGEWYQQLGGYFNDRPALTEGLLTTGIGLGAGMGGNAFAAGGQAMTNRQTTMASSAKEARDYELETMKANADILQSMALLGKGNTLDDKQKAFLEEATKQGLKGPYAQQYVLERMAGRIPQIKQRKGPMGGLRKDEYYL